MERVLRGAVVLCLIFSAGLSHSTERTELLLDMSDDMWRSLPDGTPRIVAIRNAINAFLASPLLRDLRHEIGLSTIGGKTDILEGTGCGESNQVLPIGAVDPAAWYSALGGLGPRGGRPLVFAIEETAKRLANQEGKHRIVVVTAGGDQCFRDISRSLDSLSQADNPVTVRIIGLDIDHALANSLFLSTPTRNASDEASLLEFLGWAVLPADVGKTRPEWLELRVTHGDKPLNGATVRMASPPREGETASTFENGKCRIRLPPGRYQATIEGDGIETVEVAGIVHFDGDRAVELQLKDSPSVTLEVDSNPPLAGDAVHVHYWGAPTGENWLTLAIAGSPTGAFVVRSPALGSTGEVALPLPDEPHDFEIRFTTEIGNGVLQLLGRVPFESSRRTISLEAPERIEKGTPLTLTWSGSLLPGDHVTVDPPGTESAESALCVAAAESGQVTVMAPVLPGTYTVRYFSRRGQTLARSTLEVYEVLATLDGPPRVAPGENLALHWTGPNAVHDYLSIATTDDAGDQYLSFSPTSEGSPAYLTAPRSPGTYELRYVRAEDGDVLARSTLSVTAVDITLAVPSTVEAGSRFEVSWTGTAGEGDFIAVARVGSDVDNHLDWAYTSLGSPVSLAAPFDPGRYVVRFISGASREVITRATIQVR